MRRIAPTALVACLVLLIAADDPPKPAARKDAQAAFEPRSGPGAGQAYLARFVGDWHVAKAFFRASGEPTRSEGTCHQAMIQDGRFLQSDFVFKAGERSTTGTGLIGFEPEAGRFTSVWFDSRQTRMSFRHSREEFDGQQIVLHSGSLEPEAKDARRSKTVSKIEPGDAKIVHRQYVIAPDGAERLMMELVMTRTAPAVR